MIVSERIKVSTQGATHIIDLTAHTESFLKEHSIKDGLLTVHVPGSTAAITTIEYEPGLVNHDIDAFLERIAPEAMQYAHNETWGDGNGFSHVRAALLGPSLSVPVEHGKPILGTWQQIVLIECDNRGRDRTIILHCIAN